MSDSGSDRCPLNGRSVWRSADFPDRAALMTQIPPEVGAELTDAAYALLDAGEVATITSDAATMPLTDAFVPGLLEELRHGRGFVLLGGIDGGLPLSVLERIYWMLGLRLGTPLSQSGAGDRIGYVEDRSTSSDPATARGYKSRQILPLHTDGGDMMGLMSIRNGRAGGTSVISSVHAAYNDVLATRPDLLPILERGFPYHRKGEEQPGQPEITPYDVPVLGRYGDTVLSHYVRSAIEYARRQQGGELTDSETEALDYFDAVTSSEANRIEFDLEPGEILLANNYTTFHARTEFDDWAEVDRRRLMLRVWWDGAGWDAPRELRVYENVDGRGGVDPNPSGQRSQPAFLKPYKNTGIVFEKAL